MIFYLFCLFHLFFIISGTVDLIELIATTDTSIIYIEPFGAAGPCTEISNLILFLFLSLSLYWLINGSITALLPVLLRRALAIAFLISSCLATI